VKTFPFRDGILKIVDEERIRFFFCKKKETEVKGQPI
jgi:hypothetical protein